MAVLTNPTYKIGTVSIQLLPHSGFTCTTTIAVLDVHWYFAHSEEIIAY
jgi:hypothetical protein